MLGPGLLVALVIFAQAEAAPSEPLPTPLVPAPASTPPPPPPPVVAAEAAAPGFAITIGFGGARRLGDAPRALGPRHGFEVNMAIDATYARPVGVDLSAGVRFAYQRFRKLVPLTLLGASATSFEGERTFSYYEFELLQTMALPLGLFRPYLSAGAGLTVAHFRTQELALAPAEKRATRLNFTGAAGCDFPISHRTDARIGLVIGMTFLVSPPPLQTNGGQRVRVFGNRATAGLTLLQPF